MTETVYGIHAVSSWLKSRASRAERLLVRESGDSRRLQEVVQLAEQVGCSVERVPGEVLDQLAKANHQGVVLKIRPGGELGEKDLEALLAVRTVAGQPPLLLVILDGITDPRNLGACVRSAAAACADAVILPRRNSAEMNPAAHKTASGGADLVPVYRVTNLGRTMDYLKSLGIWVTGTIPGASTDITQVDLRGHSALVLGSEGSGMREGIRKRCDYLATIPMPREAFSLNVSVAAGIVLFEAIRQRRTG